MDTGTILALAFGLFATWLQELVAGNKIHGRQAAALAMIISFAVSAVLAYAAGAFTGIPAPLADPIAFAREVGLRFTVIFTASKVIYGLWPDWIHKAAGTPPPSLSGPQLAR